jgi:hypothetical protein
MSHFVVYVIVEASILISTRAEELINERIDAMMAPYSENIKVEPYKRECWCVGNKARQEVDLRITEEFGGIDTVRDAFWQDPENQAYLSIHMADRTDADEDAKTARWNELIKPRNDATAKYFKEHPLRDAADSECSRCNGTGLYETTYNPKSQWDWYRVGGRWDGLIVNNRQYSQNGFNFSHVHETIKNNSLLLDSLPDEIDDNWIPFAIVTPDGEWHEKGDMGWWGIVNDAKSNWEQEAKEIINKYRKGEIKYMAVAVDCHI